MSLAVYACVWTLCMHRGPRESGCGPRESNGFLKELDAPGLRFPWPTVCGPRESGCGPRDSRGPRAVAHELWPMGCGPQEPNI